MPVSLIPGVSFQSRAEQVGHPVQPLPDVRRADAVCSQYQRPDGVTERRHVCANSIEPSAMVMQSRRSHDPVGKSVRTPNVTPLNRDNERSLKLASDNF
jgi:hypothetical protein